MVNYFVFSINHVTITVSNVVLILIRFISRSATAPASTFQVANPHARASATESGCLASHHSLSFHYTIMQKDPQPSPPPRHFPKIP